MAGTEAVPSEPEEEWEAGVPGATALRGAFTTLDQVDLAHTFERRPCLMKSVSRFLKGAFRNALQIAINVANSADELTAERLKLFMFIPRMLLHRPEEG